MLYIIGRISDHVIVDIADRLNVDETKLLTSIAINKGGVASDYSLLGLASDSNPARRIASGADWEAVWTGNTITSVSFSIFDSKDRLRFTSPKSEISGNGIETARINIRLINSSDADVSTTISGVYIPIQSPTGPVKKKVDLISGFAQFDFKSDTLGTWTFPIPGTKYIGDYRIKNELSIEVLL